MQNFFVPAGSMDGVRVVLSGDEYHHATRSCRVCPGDRIGVTDGRGRRVEARIEAIDRSSLTACVERDVSGRGEPSVEITLALALVKPARFEIAVEKCTELGVRKIVPLAVERCEREGARLNPDRLRRIAREAAKQSGRSWIPEILPPAGLDTVCGHPGLLLAALQESGTGITRELAGARTAAGLTILIGPEGDFTVAERALMAGCGVIPVSLGGLTLRAETAAVTAVALTVAALTESTP